MDFEQPPPAERHKFEGVLKERQLWDAATEGVLEDVVRLSLDPTVDVNWGDEERLRTPFYRACFHGQTAVVDYLQGLPQIEVNRLSRRGFSGFYAAAHYGHIDVLKLLARDPRVDMELGTHDGHTPLWAVCREGKLEAVKVLLASDLNLDVSSGGVGLRSPRGACQWALDFGGDDEEPGDRPQILKLMEAYEEDPVRTRQQVRLLPRLRGTSLLLLPILPPLVGSHPGA